MKPTNKIHTKDLLDKIEKMTKERIASQDVVPLDAFREAKKNMDPKVVLVIDDDESMRVSLKRMLEVDGLVVKLAADATELSKVIDDTPVDLILLDIGLPWINGFELGQMLKEHRDLKKIPLVFISGHVTDQELNKAAQIGADGFISKPFDVERMHETVQKLILKK